VTEICAIEATTQRTLFATMLALVLSSCGGEDEPSKRLQERSQPLDKPIEPAAEPGKSSEPDEAKPPTPVPSGPKTALRLQLEDGRRYRNTTVAMVAFPAVQKPVGYAREEELELSACKGEGDARSCTLTHRVNKFEGEPPTGKLFEQDESHVKHLVSTHELWASAKRGGTTAIEGTPGAGASASDLAQVHRFYCIRLPDAPVAVGETWTDRCATWIGGALMQREVTWTLKSIDDDPVAGKRAELRAVGKVSTGAGDTARTGTIESALFFFVDKGEPHILRERIVTSAGKSQQTTTTVNVQFAHVVGEGTQRTDGQPFPPPPAGAEPTGVPTPPASAQADAGGAAGTKPPQ
jgi:hypothetical protein